MHISVIKRICTLLLFAASVSIFAEEPLHIQAAKDFLDASNYRYAIEMNFEQLHAQLSNLTDQLEITEEQRPIFEKHLKRMRNILEEELGWEKLEPMVVDQYVRLFTEEELRKLLEFYRSPIGQKYVDRMPELIQSSSQMIQELTESYVGRFVEAYSELQAELDLPPNGNK